MLRQIVATSVVLLWLTGNGLANAEQTPRKALEALKAEGDTLEQQRLHLATTRQSLRLLDSSITKDAETLHKTETSYQKVRGDYDLPLAPVELRIWDGEVGGNGACYDTPRPPGTGRYCGKGGGPKGKACKCGLFLTDDPFPIDALDLIATDLVPIGSVVLPDIGVPRYTVQILNGTRFTTFAVVPPNVRVDFPPGGVRKFRLVGIYRSEDSDLASPGVFPLTLQPAGCGSLTVRRESFAAEMPIEIHMQQLPTQTELYWFGDSGPFVVQSAASAEGPWTETTTTEFRCLTLATVTAARFYRVKGYSGGFSSVLNVGIQSVPTLSHWALLLLALILVILGIVFVKQRNSNTPSRSVFLG